MVPTVEAGLVGGRVTGGVALAEFEFLCSCALLAFAVAAAYAMAAAFARL